MSCIVGAEKFYDFWFSADHCFLSKVIWFYESASFHCQCCLVFVWPGFRFVVTDRFRLATERRVYGARAVLVEIKPHGSRSRATRC
jgi:hypothetical protein